MTKKWFRFLIVLSWVLAAASVALFFAEMYSLPPELRAYVESELDAPLTAADMVVSVYALVALVAAAVSAVGLYRFRPWGRTLCL